jgi:hypothetical protein
MAEKKIHYYVTCEGFVEAPSCVYATSQAEAIRQFIEGDNDYGYTAEDFDGYTIQIVAASKVSEYVVEVQPRPEYELRKVS